MRASSTILGIGIVMILGGIFAILDPLAASVAITTVVGLVLLVAGGLALVSLLLDGPSGGRVWNVVVAALSVVAGFWMVTDPLAGTVSLTIIVGAILFVIGLIRALMAAAFRGTPAHLPVLLSGLLSLGVGLLVLLGGAGIQSTLLGYLLGIQLIAEGAALSALGYLGRRGGIRRPGRLHLPRRAPALCGVNHNRSARIRPPQGATVRRTTWKSSRK